MTNTNKTVSRWSWFVVVLYGGFVVFILACVGFASFQRFDLVDKQYYEKGIAHQGLIDQMNRAAALPDRPSLAYQSSPRELVVTFPLSFSTAELAGEVKLFRPSNAAYDRTVALAPSADGIQRLDMSNLPPGKWEAQLTWTYRGVSYYQEELIIAE